MIKSAKKFRGKKLSWKISFKTFLGILLGETGADFPIYNNDFGIKYFKYICSIAFGQQPFMKMTTLHLIRNDRVSVNIKKNVYTKVILTSAAELAVLISSSFPLPLFSFAQPSVSLLRLVLPVFSFLLLIAPLKFDNNVIRC